MTHKLIDIYGDSKMRRNQQTKTNIGNQCVLNVAFDSSTLKKLCVLDTNLSSLLIKYSWSTSAKRRPLFWDIVFINESINSNKFEANNWISREFYGTFKTPFNNIMTVACGERLESDDEKLT
uniref:Uncharacterized protein n=1 Tax=Romanomermis culicivorax TaxID=13658 RepID=A0A915KYG6_ROMCU